MKRCILVLMTIFAILVLSSCTTRVKPNLMVQYDKNNDLCIVNNTGKNTYDELELKLEVYNEDGYKIDVKKEIPKLKKGEKCEFKLSDLMENTSKVQQVQIAQYSFENIDGLYLAILILATIVLIAIFLMWFLS